MSDYGQWGGRLEESGKELDKHGLIQLLIFIAVAFEFCFI